MSQNCHKSVLLNEIVANLQADKSGLYVDATFGAGGYSEAILAANEKNKVIAFDRDHNVQRFVSKLQEKYNDRLLFINERFSEIKASLAKYDISEVEGVVLDLGVSSMQLDTDNRGFSFNKDALLDMQMGLNDISALEVVNNFSEQDLANIIYQFGEERESRRIARNICLARINTKIDSTVQLAKIIEDSKRYNKKSKIHPATKTFQAIRIFVNQELEELRKILAATVKILKKGGRLVVVSFHSLEDQIVKKFIRDHAAKPNVNRYLPDQNIAYEVEFKIIVNGIKPTKTEIENNPRARSAIMRVAEKI